MRTLPAATRLTQRVGGFGQDDQPRISRRDSEREPHSDRDGARDSDQTEADARFQIELEVLWAGKRAVITSSALVLSVMIRARPRHPRVLLARSFGAFFAANANC